MTIEEKLDNFQKASLSSARDKAEQIISDHQAALDKIYEEHKKTVLRQAEAEISEEKDRLKKERNKQLSTQQMRLKRNASKANTALKEKLFSEVSEKLIEYMKTPEYVEYLENKIKDSLAFAGEDQIVIYINESDSHLKEQLEKDMNTEITISKEDFTGGMRAVISTRHILVDNSFSSLQRGAHDAFNFHGGYKH